MARSVEKVARLGIARSKTGMVAFMDGAVVRFEKGKRIEVARPAIEEEEGWIYFVDGDGDVARKPQPGYKPPEAVRRKLEPQPLAMFRDLPKLAELGFTKLVARDVTIHESTVIAPANAAATWRAAQARARAGGHTAVLVQQRISSDLFDDLDSIFRRDRKKVDRLDGATVLATREHELLEQLKEVDEERDEDDEGDGSTFGVAELEQLRKALAAAKVTIPRAAPKRTYVFEANTPRLYLTLLSCQPWEVPLYLPVGGFNDAPSGVELAAVLRWWEKAWDPVPIYVAGNTFELEPRHPGTPEALRALAWQHYLIATDIVHQGTQTLAALANELAKGRWFFWWD